MSETENISEKIKFSKGSSKDNDSNDLFEFDIVGMNCTGCANSIKTYLEKLDGISGVTINFTSESGEVIHDDRKITRNEIKKLIKSLGFEAISDDEEYEKEQIKKKELKKQKIKIIASIFLSLVIMLISMKGHFMMLDGIDLPAGVSLPLLFVLSSVVIFWCGSKFITGAYKSLKHGTSDMNTLIAIGSLSSFLYSVAVTISVLIGTGMIGNAHEVYYETAAMIITFILIGNYLESVMKSKTQTSIKKLKELQAKVVNVIRDGNEIFIPFKKVKEKDIVIIKTGDKVPVDGLIIEGFCVADESAMTGESLPVEKKKGDNLMSGTVLKNGFVKMEAEKVGKDTMLSKIIELVKDAANSKPKIQKLADRISAVFVPVVIVIAVITFIYWYFIADFPVDKSLLFAVSVLIIACPCALGLASPIAIVIGVGKAAENGILFNNVNAIENLKKVNTFCFDKTGTLTTGEMKVKNIYTLNNISRDDLLKYVYSAEKHSNHPIAKSIINFGNDNNIMSIKDVKDFSNEQGFGISAKVNSKEVLIGNENLMKERNVSLPDIILQSSKNNLFVSIDKKISGIIEIEDRIKPEAPEVIQKLKENGMDVFMISGDNESNAASTARQLDISKFSYKTLPDEKEKIVADLQSKGGNVAMVGDGINDAPSLARANVGMAVGTGQEIAIDSADVILVKGELHNILKSVKISSKTVSIIKQNFFWAFFYNIVAIPFAAGVFAPYGIIISPVMAAMLMAFSDVVTVIGNSLRLKYINLDK